MALPPDNRSPARPLAPPPSRVAAAPRLPAPPPGRFARAGTEPASAPRRALDLPPPSQAPRRASLPTRTITQTEPASTPPQTLPGGTPSTTRPAGAQPAHPTASPGTGPSSPHVHASIHFEPTAGASTAGAPNPSVPHPHAEPQPGDARHGPVPAIETRNLTKRYGRFTAVNNLTIRVPRGGIIGFVGPNGAGKTTTIRVLLGLIRPSEGEAFVLGHTVKHPLRYLKRVGALIEAPAFHAQLSGRRNLEVLAMLGGHPLSRVDPLLKLVGLGERGNDQYRRYSLGMKQRLGIAAAMLPDPELLILDEPTNGLDPSGIREVRDLLRQFANEGRTVFVSSHLLAEVQRLCDHLVILRKGTLVYQGTVDNLLRSQVGLNLAPQDPRQLGALRRLVAGMGHATDAQGDSLFVRCPASLAGEINQRAMRAGIVLRELHPANVDLEETVVAMTGRGGL